MGEHAGRVAVVAGGAGAIGGAIVAELAASGHTLVVLDRAGDPPVDLADAAQVRAAAARVLETHGRCDVLVHAAAAFDKADVLARQALPRRLVPDDVAATVAFLASDAAAALTGQTLCVDGGLIPR
jgi:NAD(P)-dependent dehydrogenase (short-subunit alcohol dehydrogenase family)